MKKTIVLLLFILLSFVINSQTVKIGKQVWMTKNLNVSTFNNGDLIKEAKTNEEWKDAVKWQEPAWCYYNNDSSSAIKYGKLYNWFAINDERGIAPEGFHIPTFTEWRQLVHFLGGEDVAGRKLKTKDGWKLGLAGTNSTGFSGLPGGARGNNGTFGNKGADGYWWSSSEESEGEAWFCYMTIVNNRIDWVKGEKCFGFSIRCLKD